MVERFKLKELVYDIAIIGSGMGGGTLGYALSHSGLRVALLERGGFLPRERENWDAGAVFGKGRYKADETWLDGVGNEFHPAMHYFVGGSTKVYGAALMRLRKEDFGAVQHAEGVSPAWPIQYEDLEPYYTKAEKLFFVHGPAGGDPFGPPRSEALPFPSLVHEPYICDLERRITTLGLKPGYLPLGVDRRSNGRCIRCDTCDGFPCLLDAKADADVCCVRKSKAAMLKTVSGILPHWLADRIALHSVDWWAISEDLPDKENRVSVTADDTIQIFWKPRNLGAHEALLKTVRRILKKVGYQAVFVQRMGIGANSHQCGTARFGNRPESSVLDTFCRSHEVPNLYVVDGSFFPSSAAVNPALTIAAQALRVADRIKAINGICAARTMNHRETSVS